MSAKIEISSISFKNYNFVEKIQVFLFKIKYTKKKYLLLKNLEIKLSFFIIFKI